MAKDRRTKDQKRKAKLAQRAKEAKKFESHAYHGEKYRTEELVPLWMKTEVGIYEAYVLMDRKLTDRQVTQAVELLVKQMRHRTLPELSDQHELSFVQGQEVEFLMANILRNWETHFETKWRPPREKCIGVLRSVLGSVETHRSAGSQSQSYLSYIAGFLTKELGVTVKAISTDLPPESESAEDELVQIGRHWMHEGDHDARADFFEQANDLIRTGHCQKVIDLCHHLIAEVNDPTEECSVDLLELSEEAQQKLLASSS